MNSGITNAIVAAWSRHPIRKLDGDVFSLTLCASASVSLANVPSFVVDLVDWRVGEDIGKIKAAPDQLCMRESMITALDTSSGTEQ